MRCSVCQTINQDDANFCRSCGTTIAPAPQPTGTLPPPPPPRQAPDPLWAQTVPSTSQDLQWADSAPAPNPVEPEGFGAVSHDAYVAPTLAVPIESAPIDLRRTVSAELAARRRRNRALLIVGAIVVAAVLGVVGVFALGGDSGSTASTDPATDSVSPVVTTVAPLGATTIAEVTIVTAATATTAAAPTTAPVVLVSPPLATVAPTTAPPAPTVAPTTAPPATVATTAATSPATPAPTTTPASSVTTASSAPSPANGDLGLSTPISKPACDGQFITLIGASVDTPGVAGRVDGLLDQYPGSKYLKTELVCTSLSPRSASGDALYVVFFGPFSSTSDACAARAKGTKDSYVKVLENTSGPSGAVKC